MPILRYIFYRIIIIFDIDETSESEVLDSPETIHKELLSYVVLAVRVLKGKVELKWEF